MKRKPSRRGAGHGRNGKSAAVREPGGNKPAVAVGNVRTYSYDWADPTAAFSLNG